MDDELAAEILRRYGEDQELRARYLAALDTDPGLADSLWEQILDSTSVVSSWFADLLIQGWPRQDMIGPEAAEALGLLLNHADTQTHRLALPLVEAAVERGDAPPWVQAYVTDQVLVADGRPQCYGTFLRDVDGQLVVPPINAEADVDARRAGVGLGPLEAHIDKARATFHLQ